jgi:hypothetical protein
MNSTTIDSKTVNDAKHIFMLINKIEDINKTLSSITFSETKSTTNLNDNDKDLYHRILLNTVKDLSKAIEQNKQAYGLANAMKDLRYVKKKVMEHDYRNTANLVLPRNIPTNNANTGFEESKSNSKHSRKRRINRKTRKSRK